MGYSYDMNDRWTQTSLPDGTSWRYGYDRLSQVVSGERVSADGTPVQGGSFRYAYDGIGNRTFSQDGAANAIRRYSSNALNQYTAVAATGFIPLGGRADEDANVVVTATVDGRWETYLPERDGQGFSVDIPVDNFHGSVTATVRVDALKQGNGQQDSDLHRRLDHKT